MCIVWQVPNITPGNKPETFYDLQTLIGLLNVRSNNDYLAII